MSLTQNSFFASADFTALKARVKAEMQRRNGYGDLSTYGSATYDFSTIPASGVLLKEEHYDKIRDVLANINPTPLPVAKAAGDLVTAMNVLDTQLAIWEAKPRADETNNDCSSACSGTCVTNCTSSCVGCTSCVSCWSCTGTCTGCQWNCTGSCAGCPVDCAGTCSGGCIGSCTGGCNGCVGTCVGGCWGGCNGCGTGCSICTSCTGCSTGCLYAVT